MGERSTARTICGMCPVEVKIKMHIKRGNSGSIPSSRRAKHGNIRGIDAQSRVCVVFTN